MFKRLYYKLCIEIIVWIAGIKIELGITDIGFYHWKYWCLDELRQRAEWHYFGIPQHVKDSFYFKAMWNKTKDTYI